MTFKTKNLREGAREVYHQANKLSRGSLDIVGRAIQSFGNSRAPQAAASMAYYALFSLFPLLLVLVAVGSFVLEREVVQERLLEYVTTTLPASQQLIKHNVERALELRGPVGIAGLVALLWSATGFFNTLAHNINRAWSDADVRGVLERRLVALGIVGSLAGLLVLSLVSTAALELLPRFRIPVWGDASLYEAWVWKILSNLISWSFKFLMFLALYRWVPNTQVKWLAAVWGALMAALGWELITHAFSWYLSSGLANYELVYGSLGAIVALMFWIYLSSWIALFGAHLSAAVAHESE
jgi:membrane protein